MTLRSEFLEQLRTSLTGSYTVEHELSGAGMSRVFLAVETRLRRKVVIKLLMPELAEGISADRFEREIQLAARLQEPHIVPVISTGVANGLPYYTMPFVEGESLRAKISAGPMALADVMTILRDVASALEHAHERGVVHRDIKPENILLSRRAALVTDFGIAKAISMSKPATHSGDLTVAGTSVGTLAYMAPEQAAADPSIDHRADLYSLGVLAYELLAGVTPFGDRPPHRLLAALMSEAPAPLSSVRTDLPPALVALVMRLLAKDPSERPAGAADVLRAIDDIAVTRSGDTPEFGSTPAIAVEHPPSVASAQTAKRRRWLAAAAMALVIPTTAYGLWLLVARRGSDATQRRSTPMVEAKSIAVLPFVNTSGDAENEHFSDGLTDELIAALGKLQGLRVAARTSTFALKGRGLGVHAIADTLGVKTVLEGSVRRVGSRLKATVQLVNAGDGVVLWTEVYDRQTADVFAVQEEIASAIVRALNVRLSADERARLVGRPTRDLMAYELYLKAKYNGDIRNHERLDLAVTYYQQAAERDPTFALAYAGRADTYVAMSNFGYLPSAEALAKAQVAVDRAIALDSTMGEAHASRGFLLASRMAFVESETELRRAIELNPSYPWAYHYYSLLLMMLGRNDEALQQNGRVLLLDPLSLPGTANRGVLLTLQHDFAGAEGQLRRAMAMDANFPLTTYYLGVVEAQQGRFADAVALLEHANERAPTFPGVKSALEYAYARAGRKSDADALIAALRAAGGKDDRSRINLAFGEAVMGHVDRAFTSLEGVRWDIPTLIELRADPLLEALRRDPRYARLLADMGLRP